MVKLIIIWAFPGPISRNLRRAPSSQSISLAVSFVPLDFGQVSHPEHVSSWCRRAAVGEASEKRRRRQGMTQLICELLSIDKHSAVWRSLAQLGSERVHERFLLALLKSDIFFIVFLVRPPPAPALRNIKM